MPKRIVDGEALWTSRKLKNVQPEALRSHYAMWIPLAEANGVFEADPDLILARVYAFAFPSADLKFVKKVLSEFQRVGLLELWEQDGKTWAYFTGIDKPGRLPSEKHQERYNNLPPEPPGKSRTLPETPGLSGNMPEGFGFGFGSGSGFGVGVGAPIERASKSGSAEDEIAHRAMSALGRVEEKKFYRKGLQALVAKNGLEAVLRAFDTWVASNPQFTGSRPASAFLRSASAILSQGSNPAAPSLAEAGDLQLVLDQIAYLSDNDVTFNVDQRWRVLEMLRSSSPDELLQAFKDFYSRIETDNDRKWAAKDFVEKGPQFIRTIQRRKQERLETEQTIARQKDQMQAEVAPELDRVLNEAELETQLAAEEAEKFGNDV